MLFRAINPKVTAFLRNVPPTTALPLIYIHLFVDVRERFFVAWPYGLKRTIVGEASAESKDVAAHAAKAAVGGASTFQVIPLSHQSYVDALD